MRLEKNLQTYVKDRLEVRGTRYEGDAEIFYKMVISNIFVLSYALTYSNQLSTDFDGFETTVCLECLQILDVLYMAGRSALKLETG